MGSVVFDDAFFAGDQRAALADLVAAGPLHRFVIARSGMSGVLVTGAEAAKQALTSPALVKDAESMAGMNAPSPEAGRGARLRWWGVRMVVSHMLGSEGTEHVRLRGLVSQQFTASAASAQSPMIKTVIQDLLDDIASAQSPIVDLVSEFATVVPVAVICQVLGVPPRQVRWVAKASAVLGDPMLADRTSQQRAVMAFVAILVPRLMTRMLIGRRDLLSDLASAVRRREASFSEALSTASLLLIAGHETASSAISHTALALLADPMARREITESGDGSAAIDRAVDEALRLDPPLPVATMRRACRRVEIAGEVVEEGEWVMVSLLAANMDQPRAAPTQTSDGRVAARTVPHVAFGYGPHFCIGSHLGRLETSLAVSALLRRFPDSELAIARDRVQWRRSLAFRQLERLPVRLRGRAL